jgi:hypothetical protein
MRKPEDSWKEQRVCQFCHCANAEEDSWDAEEVCPNCGETNDLHLVIISIPMCTTVGVWRNEQLTKED